MCMSATGCRQDGRHAALVALHAGGQQGRFKNLPVDGSILLLAGSGVSQVLVTGAT